MAQAKKDSTWNSLEIAKLATAILIPIALWRVGVWATAQLQEAAYERARTESELAYERAREQFLAAQNLEVSKFYFQAMESSNFCKRGAQLRLVVARGTPSVVKDLLSDFAQTCGQPGDSSGPDALAAAIDASWQRQIKEIISGMEGPARGAARVELRRAYEAAPDSVAAPIANALLRNMQNYQVTLGILVALGTANVNWSRNGPLGPPFEQLKKSANSSDSTFSYWLNRAEKNRSS